MRRLSLFSIFVVLMLFGAALAAQIDLNQAVTGRYDLSTGTFTEDVAGASPYGVTIDMIRNEIKLLDPDTVNDQAIPAVDLSFAAVSETAFRVVSGDDGLVKVGDPDILMMDADFGIIRGSTIQLDSVTINGNRSVIADANATVVLYPIETETMATVVEELLKDQSTSPKVYTVSLSAGDKILVQLMGYPHDAYIFFPGHTNTQAAINAASSNSWTAVYKEWVKDQANGKKIWYPSTATIFTAPQDGQYTIIVVKFQGAGNSFSIAVKKITTGSPPPGSGNPGSGSNNGGQNNGGQQSTGVAFNDFISNYGLYIAAGVGVLFLLILAMGGFSGPKRGSLELKQMLVLLLAFGGIALAVLAFINSTYLTYVAYGLGAIGLFVLIMFFASRKGYRLF